MPNILEKTKTYLVGHMQYSEGKNWREYVEKELTDLNITALNPYKQPFIKDIEEDDAARLRMAEDMANGNYSDVVERMSVVRSHDLNLVDRCDFIIAHLLPEVASWGSAEELVTAVRMKKPVFISMEGGKCNTPLWVMGWKIDNFIYDSIDEVLDVVKKIDSGEKEIDSKRWRLLKKELR
jgi:hypothetical protein